MDGEAADQVQEERVRQVLELFNTRRRGLQLLAASRCRHDERLLGAVAQLNDGLWAWHAGSRLSPQASRREVGSWHLDLVDSEDLDPHVYQQAEEHVDEFLAGQQRYETPASVVKVTSYGPGGDFQVGPWHGATHALQFFSNGLPLLQPASCNCRRAYHVQMLALVYAGVCVAAGSLQADFHVKAMPIARGGQAADTTGFAYSFGTAGVQVLLEQQ